MVEVIRLSIIIKILIPNMVGHCRKAVVEPRILQQFPDYLKICPHKPAMCLSWLVAAVVAFIVMEQAMLALVVTLVFLAMAVVAQHQVHILLPIRQHRVQEEQEHHLDKGHLIPGKQIIDTDLLAAAAAGMAAGTNKMRKIHTLPNWFTVTAAALGISNPL